MDNIENLYKLTAAGWGSSPDPVKLAEVLRKIYDFGYNGAPAEVYQMCERLLHKNENPAVNDSGLDLLLNLVSKRWGDLSDQVKETIFRDAHLIIASAAKTNEWSDKSKTAMIVSNLIGKGGTVAWDKLVSASESYLKCDKIMAEKTIITCLSEVITIPNDGSKDKRIRIMKTQNWDWLPGTLFPLLLKHLADSDLAQVDAAQQHYELTSCIANTVSAYAQWGEVKHLAKEMYWIKSCKQMLGYQGLFPAAFAYLSGICMRLQPGDCDHCVLLYIFNNIFDLLKTALVSELRQTVCSSLISVKKTLGVDFEQLEEAVTESLETMKVDGSLTDTEYEQLSNGLSCDFMDI
ncbi:unnamed protein product [Alopecurus aequalis]